MRREPSWWCVVTGRAAEVTNKGAPLSDPLAGEAAQACLEGGGEGGAVGLKRQSEGVRGAKATAPLPCPSGIALTTPG